MNYYLVLDTETGGLDPAKHSLLTVYMGLYDSNFKKIHSIHLSIKSVDGTYRVTPEAMAINKINLSEHNAKALLFDLARQQVLQFIDIDHTLTPVGHNVAFDIAFITQALNLQEEWKRKVSHRVIDTAGISQFLKLAGRIPSEVKGNLGSLVKHFAIPVTGELHDAEVDGNATLEVMKALLNLVK